MLKTIGIIVFVLIAGVLILAATRPDTFRVERSTSIADSVPPYRIAIKLDFVKPFEAHNDVVFTLEPKGNTTHVRWTMQGQTPYFAKIVHLFLDMDKMVGKDFEAGLASLKAIAEK